MKRKLRIFSHLAIICLSVCMFAFGVYAASTVSVTTSGTVSFSATGVYAEVSGIITGMSGTAPTLATLKYSATEEPSISDLDSWKNIGLSIADAETPIKLTITITNKAEDRNLDYAIADNSTNPSNVGRRVINSANMYDTENKLYNVNPKAENINNVETIEITFYVIDSNSSASLNFSYSIELKDQAIVTGNAESSQDLTKVGNTYLKATTIASNKQLNPLEVVGTTDYYEYYPTVSGTTVYSAFHVYGTGFTGITESFDDLSSCIGKEGNMMNVFYIDKYSESSLTIPMAANSSGTIFLITKTEGSNTSTSEVILPITLIEIGEEAFGNGGGITLPKGLPDYIEIIGGNAFNGCSNMTLTKLPSKLKKIGWSETYMVSSQAFMGVNFEGALIIPPTIEYVAGWSFVDVPVKIIISQCIAEFDECAIYSLRDSVEYEGTVEEFTKLNKNLGVDVPPGGTVVCSDGTYVQPEN